MTNEQLEDRVKELTLVATQLTKTIGEIENEELKQHIAKLISEFAIDLTEINIKMKAKIKELNLDLM